MEQRNIIIHYNVILREFLIEYEGSAEIILIKDEKEPDSHKTKIYLPKSLSINDKISILDKYSESNDANLNYLDLIVIAKNTEDLKITDKLRLKAKKATNTITKLSHIIIYHHQIRVL